MKIDLVIKGKNYSHVVYRIVGAIYFIMAIVTAVVGYVAKTENMTFNHYSTVLIFILVVFYLIDKASEYISIKKIK